MHVIRDGGEVGKTIHQRKNILCSWFAMQWMTIWQHIIWQCATAPWFIGRLPHDDFWIVFHLQVTDQGRSSVHKIVHNVLGFWKLSSRWVPHLLTNKHMKNQTGATLSFLWAYEGEDGLIRRIITEDETYIHYWTPMSKQQSVAWCVNLMSLHWRRPRLLAPGQNYGDRFLGLVGHFTPRIPSRGCQYHSRHLRPDA